MQSGMNRQTGSIGIVIIGVVVVLILGTLGYLYWNNVMNTQVDNIQQSVTSQEIVFSHETAEVSLEIPESWTYAEVRPEISGEKYLIVKDEEGALELRYMIQPTYIGSTSSDNIAYKTFSGINDVEQYLFGYQTGHGPQTLDDTKFSYFQLSNCPSEFCITEINDNYDLNIVIHSAKNPQVEEIELAHPSISQMIEIINSTRI
jgi:hypothetical protein